jgi:hypothetical protein
MSAFVIESWRGDQVTVRGGGGGGGGGGGSGGGGRES